MTSLSQARTSADPALDSGRPSGQSSLFAIAEATGIETARAVARYATEAWWTALAARNGAARLSIAPLPRDCPLATQQHQVRAEASAFGRALSNKPVPEAMAALGHLYTQAIPRAHRAAHGIYYTPQPLVRCLLDQAEAAGHDWSTARAIDPSCGAGAFLIEAADRMLATLRSVAPPLALAALASRLVGWDADPFAVWLANVAVEAIALPLVIESGRRLAPVATTRNALDPFEDAAGAFTLVMGNPPFGKVKDSQELRARFNRSLFGHPNLYGLFVDLAVHLAANGGNIAYLTPASFLAGQYFRNLRRTLHHLAPPRTLDLVESRKEAFADVLQEVVLSVFSRGATPRPAACAAITPANGTVEASPTGALILPTDPQAPWIFPRRAGDEPLVRRLHRLPTRLADWGYAVSTGPLVWNRHKPRLHAEPGKNRVPVIWAESVTQDGRFVLRATKRNHSPWYEPTGQDDPNIVTGPSILVQRTTAKEQHRRLISAEMPASLLASQRAVAVENHLNMVRPHGKHAILPLPIVAAFLATSAADRVLRCINASVAVSASELEAMPLPTAEQVLSAYAAGDFARRIARIYGIDP